MDEQEAINYLRDIRLISDEPAQVTSLTGGVSSNIYLVETASAQWVLKQALEQLRVKDDWRCDPARSLNEYDALCYAQTLFPEAVPRTAHVDRNRHLFVMEFLGGNFVQWKQQLLAGEIDLRTAEHAARLLAILHSQSWLNENVAQRFCNMNDFYSLRIAPYLITAGQRNPELRALLDEEAVRLQHTRLALVHGDWSSKNILTDGQRIVVLDWEVACYADPAFDAAFFLNLIYLKSLYNRALADAYHKLIDSFQTAYRLANPYYDCDLEQRIVRLTLMLMLACVDGKSPAEYLTRERDQQLVRRFVRDALLANVDTPAELDLRWQNALRTI